MHFSFQLFSIHFERLNFEANCYGALVYRGLPVFSSLLPVLVSQRYIYGSYIDYITYFRLLCYIVTCTVFRFTSTITHVIANASVQ